MLKYPAAVGSPAAIDGFNDVESPAIAPVAAPIPGVDPTELAAFVTAFVPLPHSLSPSKAPDAAPLNMLPSPEAVAPAMPSAPFVAALAFCASRLFNRF